MITHKQILDAFIYDNGILRWRKSRGSMKINSIAGCIEGDGYIQIRFMRKTFFAHRLVWFYHHGKWPTDMIDHINRNRADNRIENLRECNNAENQQNRSIVGVSPTKSGKFSAYIKHNGIGHRLGIFNTYDEALKVYKVAKVKFHTFHPTI